MLCSMARSRAQCMGTTGPWEAAAQAQGEHSNSVWVGTGWIWAQFPTESWILLGQLSWACVPKFSGCLSGNSLPTAAELPRS